MEKIILTTKDELENLIQISVRKAMGEQSQQATHNGTEFLTIKGAAGFLNLAIQTVYGLTSKREIPFLKKGKKLYFKKSELENWLNAGKRKSVDEIKEDLKGGKG